MKKLILPALLLAGTSLCAQQKYWQLSKDGGIQWVTKQGQQHTDHFEMSGKQLSAILKYGVKDGRMVISRKLVFPMLRTIPNDTRGNLIREFNGNFAEQILINGVQAIERPVSFSIRGALQTTSELQQGLSLRRNVFPSTDKAAYIESFTIRNNSAAAVAVKIPAIDSVNITDEKRGVYGAYVIEHKVYNSGDHTLQPGNELHCWITITAKKKAEGSVYVSDAWEWEKRTAMVDELQEKLVLETPDPVINRMFSFAKIRAAESIYETKAGLMHGPGGGEYYAAIWANDQAEYVNPFFAYLGNSAGIESARNSFRLFAKYMNPEFKPIPSSIVAEGVDFWNGAGDRGDQAMIGYGAALFALTHADTTEARDLWPLIEWCNQYLLKRKSANGVIESESDELEGRFPAGKFNLSTNALAYGSFLYGARLAECLGKPGTAAALKYEAEQLRTNMEKYFGGKVEGFNTYKYYDGNDKLRSWICLPLVMGIYDRKDQTQAALLSPKLWSPNGLLTESGSKTYWDRSTLYAFRGLFKAGATDTTIKYLSYYSGMRLLGEHVPYAIEAWPEGNQRHLSAESGLYCRAIVEGLLGLDAEGFRTFTLCPKLPGNWDSMSLKNIHAFNTVFNITVQRVSGKYRVSVEEKGKTVQTRTWNGENSLHFTF